MDIHTLIDGGGGGVDVDDLGGVCLVYVHVHVYIYICCVPYSRETLNAVPSGILSKCPKKGKRKRIQIIYSPPLSKKGSIL